jgi:hypothetical protein
MLADGYAVIWDRIIGEKEHQFDWFFHAEGKKFSLVVPAESSSASNRVKFPYPFITDVKKYAPDKTFVAQWDLGGAGLSAWVMNQPGQTAFSGQFPTPEVRRVPLLVLRQKARDAEFLVVLRPWQTAEKSGDPEVQFEHEGDSTLATVKIGGRTDHIRLGKTVEYSRGDANPISVKLEE